MEDDKVGYRKPPKEHRFKPGTSGNPKGRSKTYWSQSFSELVHDELKSEVMVAENGKRKKLPKSVILAKNLVKEAMQINPVALKILSQITDRFTKDGCGPTSTDFRMTSAGMAMVEAMAEDIRTWQADKGTEDEAVRCADADRREEPPES